MSIPGCASINFAWLPAEPLPELPRGWIYAGAACGGHYTIVPDPNFTGERAPAPPGAIIPSTESASIPQVDDPLAQEVTGGTE